MTSELSQPSGLLPMELPSMSSPVAFRAKTSLLRAAATALKGSVAGFGPRSSASIAKYDHASSSWRTSQTCLMALVTDLGHGLGEFSETWPKSGLMRNGIAYRLPLSVLHTYESGRGYWPTPQKFDGNMVRQTASDEATLRRLGKGGCSNLTEWICAPHLFAHRIPLGDWTFGIGSPNPQFSEWLMGFPINWTALEPSATA